MYELFIKIEILVEKSIQIFCSLSICTHDNYCSVERRAHTHTQNPKNEIETKTEERGDPNNERAPKTSSQTKDLDLFLHNHGQSYHKSKNPPTQTLLKYLLC